MPTNESIVNGKLVIIATHPVTLHNLMRGQLAFFREQGWDVLAVASPGAELDDTARREQVGVAAVEMRREISPLLDLWALWRLVRLLRHVRPAIVNAGTAKAGLLGMCAARLCGVPVRIYTLRGLRAETMHGLRARLLRMTERLASALATHIVCVSPSLQERYLRDRFAPRAKITVLHHGSSTGVDVARFTPRGDDHSSSSLRQAWHIAAESPLIGYVGRLVRDKGIADLLDAFDLVLARRADARLLLVGDFEAGDPLPAAVRNRIEQDARIIARGPLDDPADAYRAMDVLAFASHREGFPNACLEAAATGVPAVGFAATGTVDAIEDGVTGCLVPPGDTQALADGLLHYLQDEDLRRRHGQAGRARVERCFRDKDVWAAWHEFYTQAIEHPRGEASAEPVEELTP